MAEVIAFNQPRIFSIAQAQELLPIVRRITKRAHDHVQSLGRKLDQGMESRTDIESQIVGLYQEWAKKMEKLGLEPKGMWLVDFDRGDGYYCWRFPEQEIEFFHGYREGFQGREKVH